MAEDEALDNEAPRRSVLRQLEENDDATEIVEAAERQRERADVAFAAARRLERARADATEALTQQLKTTRQPTTFGSQARPRALFLPP